MTRLVGKTCFITGAAQGIGRAIAERFVSEGAAVIAADLRFGTNALAESTQITRHEIDVTDESSVIALAGKNPHVSVLVNCVGFVANGSVLNCGPTDFDRSMNINVRSMYLSIREFLPGMLSRGNGSIVNIASVVSSIAAAPNRFAYATSKAAVIGLTMSVARDYIDRGIRCNAISPGTVDSPSLNERFAATGDVEKARKNFIMRQPMGRLGQPEEIAAVAALLASDESQFMSGSNIVIDGGMSL
jgi:2-keto-3-deoxy-L-fuconate dehydrogenase